MGNSLKCCLACMLPCGAFDVIRIVHLNGRVDEFPPPITVHEILEANPNHILSTYSDNGTRQIMIVPPNSDLKRGQIYFLIPVPEKKGRKQKKKRCDNYAYSKESVNGNFCKVSNGDDYLKEILSESKPSYHRRRSVRRAVWRPKLESIPEES